MIEHIIILLVIPPLLLTGTDKEFLNKVFSKPKSEKFGNIIFNPIVAWFLGVGSMWFWHIPYFFRLMKSLSLCSFNPNDFIISTGNYFYLAGFYSNKITKT